MQFFPKTVDSQFLIRVIKNEVSPEEREFFESWLQESEDHKEEFGNFILLWDKIGNIKVPDPPLAENQFLKIKNSIAVSDSAFVKKPVYSSAKYNQNLSLEENSGKGDISWPGSRESWLGLMDWPLRIAATIAVVFFVYFLFSTVNDRSLDEPAANDTRSMQQIVKVTLKGEKSTVLLADGTIVYMNSNSRLSYPKSFSGPVRQVELLGEAYFDVAHNKLQPFRVKTGGTITEVVGTEFNIKYRSRKLDLVVTKGAVKAYKENSDKFVSLTKGKMVTCNLNSGFTDPVKVDVHRYTAWRENKLSFVHAPLTEVMNEIESFYNVQIIYKNKFIKDKTLTGIFDTDSLDSILSMISLTMDMNISREGKRIIVR